MIEILAPAGGTEALRAAVFAGADAVYMGGPLFSARASAENFSLESLGESLTFARERGVRCYVAVNTLLKDRELPQAVALVEFLCAQGADGLIIQDMGLFALLRRACPALPLHGSTQMSIHSPGGARLLKNLGACRVVLARELSLTEIEEINDSVDIELEAFVHGALCMSVSGQCYFSAMLGSRSGNRGRCAQPCRLPFGAPGGTGSDLSLKDLSFIDEIHTLEKAGVCSAKIEGRMKRPEYVAAAVRAACLARDTGVVPPELREGLEAVFSRSGFTKGYLTGKLGRDMFGIRTKEDVVSGTGALFGKLHDLYKTECQRVPVHLELTLYTGQAPVLIIKDEAGNRVQVIGAQAAEKAVSRPLTKEDLEVRLSKLGGTPYYAKSVNCLTDGISVLPAALINSLRRQAIEELGVLRRRVKPIPFHPVESSEQPYRCPCPELRAEFRELKQVPQNLSALAWVYLPLEAPPEDFSALMRRGGIQVGAVVPRAFFGAEQTVRQKIKELAQLGVAAFSCGNLGAVQLCGELGVPVHGAYSLNITNTQALTAFQALGLCCAELSFELTLSEIRTLGGALPRGLMVYGRQALMLTRNCPLANGGCKGCKTPGTLKDRKGLHFPVLCRNQQKNGRRYPPLYAEVFNSLPLSLSDKMHEIAGADFGVLRFTVENSVEAGEILDAFVRQESTGGDCTRGLFFRGVQ